MKSFLISFFFHDVAVDFELLAGASTVTIVKPITSTLVKV